MRLICPNCDAEYEVDASLIPQEGRDVQCSNCGHAWFQASPTVEAEIEAEEALFAPGAGLTAEAPPTATVEDDPEDDETPLLAAEMAATPSLGPAATPAARNIDSSVLAVLREEAEREAKARETEASLIETQTEMGLESEVPGAAALVKSRIARMKGDAEAHSENAEPNPKVASKREMLPEIETINSTLRATSEKRAGDSAAIAETMIPAQAATHGFRRGFVLAILFVVLALMVYVLAPRLAAAVPALAGPLGAYVGFVDGLRLVVDRILQGTSGG